MALIRRCDRCGAENADNHGKCVKFCEFNSDRSPIGGYELCENCVHQVKAFMQPIPQEKPVSR